VIIKNRVSYIIREFDLSNLKSSEGGLQGNVYTPYGIVEVNSLDGVTHLTFVKDGLRYVQHSYQRLNMDNVVHAVDSFVEALQ